jgi:hypothetical protein
MNSYKPFRGLPPLRGGSGSSSHKGGTGTVPRTPELKRKNFLVAGVLLAFVGAIYVTALRKLSGVCPFLFPNTSFLINLFFSITCQGASNQLTELENLEKNTK